MIRVLLAASLMIGCSTALAGETHDLYDAPGSGPKDVQHLTPPRGAGDHGISELGIERSARFGRCPVYTFIVSNDGTFRYTDVSYVDHMGEFTGTVPVQEFDWLAQFTKSRAT
jgi:hypothetical protein